MKYIIEVDEFPINCVYTDSVNWHRVYKEKNTNKSFTQAELKKLEPVSDALQHGYKEGYQDGLNDAWECARKLMLRSGRSYADIYKIFGNGSEHFVLRTFSPSEAIAKINAYEEARKKAEAEIKVGDEVYFCDKNHTRVVFSIFYENAKEPRALQFTESGKYVVDNISDLHKTGRHFPQIEEVLKQMKGE